MTEQPNQTPSSRASVRCKHCQTPINDEPCECDGAARYRANLALYQIINMKSCLLADAQVLARSALPKDWRPFTVVRGATDEDKHE